MLTTTYSFIVNFVYKMSHKEWRKIAKRERRRKVRVAKAIQLKEDSLRAQALLESEPGYAEWKKEQEAIEIFEHLELERINYEENEKWLQAEIVAQIAWKELQHKIERARLERVHQEIRIRKEWEEEQQKVQEMQLKLKQIEEEKQKQYELFVENLESFLKGDTDILPPELSESRQSKPNSELCPFFAKTASCRFGDACSRNHVYPRVSKVLLAPNFYTQFDTDLVLDYDDNETYKEFKDFFYDVVPEFEKFGEVIQFKVCNNCERHLRGNMYVEYSELRAALAAYRALHTRWYAGRQLSLVFCQLQSWSSAVCGMFLSRRCPKGNSCNFMHVFKNPDDIFDRRSTRRQSHARDKRTARNWRWSESPEPAPRRSVRRSSSPRRHGSHSRLRKRDSRRSISRSDNKAHQRRDKERIKR